MRVVIDTNVWLSALISLEIRRRLSSIIGQPDIEIFGTDILLEELKEVMRRPKFRKYITETQASDFYSLVKDRIDVISPKSQISICRDPNDDFLLAICRDAEIDFMITGDKDLLSLNPFEKTRILTLSEFEELL